MKSVYSPNDFLHLPSDSEMIQAAVDEAAKYGATVEIPRYNERTGKFLWQIDKTVVSPNCKGRNIRFSHLVGCAGLARVFGGNSELEVKTEDIVTVDESTPLSDTVRLI